SVTFGKTRMHQGPAIQNIFTFLEVGIFVAGEGVDDGWKIFIRLTMTEPAEISPCAAAQVIAGAVAEQFGILARVIAEDIARRDESFLFVRGARAKIPVSLRANFAANLAVKGDKKGDHDFVIAGFFGVLEEVLYDGMVARAVERLSEVCQQLFARPGTRI